MRVRRRKLLAEPNPRSSSREASTRNSCAVTIASSRASWGFATGTPYRSAADERLWRRLDPGARARSPSAGRRSSASPTSGAVRRRDGGGSRSRRSRTRPAGTGRSGRHGASRRRPRAAAPPRDPWAGCRGSSSTPRSRAPRAPRAGGRLAHDDASPAHRNDTERHDRVAFAIEPGRLEIQRGELRSSPRARTHRPRRPGGRPQRHRITSSSVTTPSMRRSIAPVGTRSTIWIENAIAIAAAPSRRIPSSRS